jgi:hypothetical protein
MIEYQPADDNWDPFLSDQEDPLPLNLGLLQEQ